MDLGEKILTIAAKTGNSFLFNAIWDDKRYDVSNPYFLLVAASHEQNHMVELLLQKGFDVNAKCPECDNDTALHVACRNGLLDIASKLIAQGANLYSKNARGETCKQLMIEDQIYQDSKRSKFTLGHLIE